MLPKPIVSRSQGKFLFYFSVKLKKMLLNKGKAVFTQPQVVYDVLQIFDQPTP